MKWLPNFHGKVLLPSLICSTWVSDTSVPVPPPLSRMRGTSRDRRSRNRRRNSCTNSPRTVNFSPQRGAAAGPPSCHQTAIHSESCHPSLLVHYSDISCTAPCHSLLATYPASVCVSVRFSVPFPPFRQCGLCSISDFLILL